ncbi:MFS transporter [Macrococcus capreoli]|uniref:MFS transporter n=1 Tax=Macrococcus capreoli TaxID=2982690 RepID=UPI003F4407F3
MTLSPFHQLLLGRLFTNAADSIYFITSSLYIFEITQSVMISGFTTSAMLAVKFTQLFYGPVIDHFNVKRILIFSQCSQSILMAILAICVMNQNNHWSLIITLVVLSMLCGEVSYPISNKLVPQLLCKEKRIKGNAQLTFVNNTLDIVLNTVIAGLFIKLDTQFFYFFSAILFLFAVFFYALLPGVNQTNLDKHAKFNYFNSLRSGIRIVTSSYIWIFIIGAFSVNLGIGIVYGALPTLAHEIDNPVYYGLFLATMSIGMILSTFIANQFNNKALGKLMIFLFVAAGTSIVLGLFIPLPYYLLFYCLSWVMVGIANILLVSVNQSIIPNEYLARVSSVSNSVGILGLPLGSLLAGILLKYISAIQLISLSGICYFALSLLWLLIPTLRKQKEIMHITKNDFGIKSKK